MENGLYQFVMEQLANAAVSYREIAEGSGVSRRTIEKIARREIESPGIQKIEKLAEYFRREQVS
jgi:transcriptional regulator with XRE-family HTH domain